MSSLSLFSIDELTNDTQLSDEDQGKNKKDITFGYHNQHNTLHFNGCEHCGISYNCPKHAGPKLHSNKGCGADIVSNDTPSRNTRYGANRKR